MDVMHAEDMSKLDQELIDRLRLMMLQGADPSHILSFLKTQVQDKYSFVDYMQAICPDDECDEGTIWLVAGRWWTGNQTAYGANRLLGPIFAQARERWLRRQDSQ
jgi:hypothetical protein